MFGTKALLASLTAALACGQTITTYAGNGTAGFSGDNGPATQAQINRVVGLAVDSDGNLYLADENNHRVRKVDRNGVITTFAGTGTAGFSGDGGPATQAQFNKPLGVCVDTRGNVYVNDNDNRRVRRISPNGLITTVFGNGSNVHGGDGGPAFAGGAVLPIRCAIDRAGSVLFVDQGAHRVRKVEGGNVTTIAGTGAQGFSGDGGPATAATLNNPTAISVDASDNIYITDQFNHRIRRINPAGTIETVAFNGTSAFNGDGVPALSASSSFPGSTVPDSAGNLYIADSNSHRIRKLSGGTISTIAGNGAKTYAGDGGNPLQASFNDPFAIALDSSGNLYVGDTTNHRIRRISLVAIGTGPQISAADVQNAGSFQAGISPGGIVTIFGTNLGAQRGEVITPPGNTWPARLGGVSVTMDGTPAPVYRLLNLEGAREQISVQAPYSLSGRNSVSVVVTTPAGSSAPVNVPVLGAQPGIFIIDYNNFAGAFLHGADNSVITTNSPAARNEVIVLYLTGMGPVTDGPASGEAAPLTRLVRTVLAPTVRIGGFNAAVDFSGLAPGFIGLYQINVAVPAAVATGLVDVTVEANGVTSNVAKLSVRQ